MSELYPLLLLPEFYERVWGTHDLSLIYPHKTAWQGGEFDKPIGEAWLTGDACRVANGPLAGQTLVEVTKRFGSELLGVLVGGSRMRSEGDPHSDIDVVVVVDRPYRKRWNFVIGGVEVETLINPPFQMRRYFEEERQDGHRLFLQAQGRAEGRHQGRALVRHEGGQGRAQSARAQPGDAERAGDHSRWNALVSQAIGEWEVLHRLYEDAAPSQEVKAHLEREYAEALGDERRPHHH